jgi:pSer/pThr/pTyr-binding forkhead associated (FHA) protein
MVMRIRAPGKKALRLRQGHTLTIGRHSDNDLVLGGGGVSRYHGRVVWDKDEDRPYIEDLKSANGIDVDGNLIDERQYLLGKSTHVEVGSHLLVFELVESGGTARIKAALLDSAGSGPDKTMVHLFSDKGAAIEGKFSVQHQLRRAMVLIESEDRTGTLKVTCPDQSYRVTFSQGHIVTAISGDGVAGQEAWVALLGEAGGKFRFSREIEPSEATLDISASELFMDDETRQILGNRTEPKDA